jgi:hypothetical protein
MGSRFRLWHTSLYDCIVYSIVYCFVMYTCLFHHNVGTAFSIEHERIPVEHDT